MESDIKQLHSLALCPWPYRTLHSYNLIWAVCHLFPQQRWRTHTNIQSRETIGQENHVTCVKLRPRKFRPAFFGADSKTRIFYKYVVFKHSFYFFPNFHCSADTLSLQCDILLIHQQKWKAKKWISLADIHSFNIHWL